MDDLLARMTLAEKVGQLVQVTPGQVADVDARIRAGRIGSLLSINDAERIEYYQRLAGESRLGIPLIVGNDVIHGYRTVFPIPLAEACTWDPPLLERAACASAEEAAAAGTDWIFAPMVDVSRDPRWGRIAEGAGEDPFLGGVLAQARVRGFLRAGTEACPKHYVAYGAAEAGRDYNTVDVSERMLREVYLPPFKAAFDAGADSVMSAFNDIAGLPATCNPFTLRSILRDEWQWPGVVVSDYTAIAELIQHGVAADLKDAARLSILAGVDMDMMSEAYSAHLEALVQEGAVPERLVDEAAGRVLRLKRKLGLFDRQPSNTRPREQPRSAGDARALALEVAQQSMVLVKNAGGLLPLAPDVRLAVVGPLADARADLLGCWAPMGRAEDVESVLDGLRVYLGRRPVHVAGCPVRSDAPTDFAAAVEAARAADVVLLVVGESANMSGEAHSRAHLGLPGRQQDLVDALAETGKPLVCVLLSGRPLVIPGLCDQVAALLVAWHGGVRAGRAVADLLFGAVSPSGRLTACWPRAVGQIPVYYAHKNTGRPIEGPGTTQFDEPFKSTYINEANAPLFPFGYGLGYTRFQYTDLTVETPELPLDGTLVASVTLTNAGPRPGTEVVQVYVRDVLANVTRPVRELKAFRRVSLEPGESQRIRFEIPVSTLGFIGLEMRDTVEPGEFRLWIAPDSTSGPEGSFVLQPAS